MKKQPLFLTQGDAFNIWSALGKVASETNDKTVLDLEEMLRQHLQTYPMTVKSDSLGKNNPCKDCRHAEFDKEENPYCMISDPIGECTSDIESCESHDPITIRSDKLRIDEDG